LLFLLTILSSAISFWEYCFFAGAGSTFCEGAVAVFFTAADFSLVAAGSSAKGFTSA
jgi:hypothetical protein